MSDQHSDQDADTILAILPLDECPDLLLAPTNAGCRTRITVVQRNRKTLRFRRAVLSSTASRMTRGGAHLSLTATSCVAFAYKFGRS